MPRGTYKRTTEIKKKMALAQHRYLQNNQPQFTGHKHTEETKVRMRKTKIKGKKEHKFYFMIYLPNHPNRDRWGYVLEHRLVMEQMLGRYLKPKEVVHHINNIRSDNRIKNLMLFPNNRAHLEFHRENNA